jgi:hypothetical protein
MHQVTRLRHSQRLYIKVRIYTGCNPLFPFYQFPQYLYPLSMGFQTQKVAEAKKAQAQADLATALPYDSSLHDEFLRATAKDITDRIQRGEWTASVVLEAYIARATYAHRQTNCLTESTCFSYSIICAGLHG